MKGRGLSRGLLTRIAQQIRIQEGFAGNYESKKKNPSMTYRLPCLRNSFTKPPLVGRVDMASPFRALEEDQEKRSVVQNTFNGLSLFFNF
ncbi:hypothetical protein ACOSQ2_006425 [Xanthoceras sorbifolium]